ncbi:MAG: Gfo/Idh/MocA family oxidoreductase [Calditrichaeota bacterium]|nr:Gfo/Idh/MocA family oxidoreductase [Calditrichota bacterium]
MSKKKKTTKRRDFIKRTLITVSGSLAFPYIVKASALGLNGHVPPSERITIGCIGVGGMGTSNLQAFLSKKEARVVAVCDVDKEHRLAAKRLTDEIYGNSDCALYNDFRELLARDDIDAIMTATPDHWHALIAVAAARAGKDIYAEKPLAYSIAEGRAIVDAVRRYGVIWQTGSWQRSQSHFRLACELVRNGRIGRVHTVRVGLPTGNSVNKVNPKPTKPPEGFDYDFWLGPAPWRPYTPGRCHWNFRWISDYSGGQITDWAGHHCDIANWGMNTEHSAPRFIEGWAEFPSGEDGLYDTPGRYYFEALYEEGFKMIVADRKQQPKDMGVHFIGDEGWIHVSRAGVDAYPKSVLKTPIAPNEIHLYQSNDHHQNFLDCVKTRKQTITPVDVAHYSIMVGHLGLIAIKTGRRVEWDVKREKFVNDPDADRYLSRPMRSPWKL